MESLESKLDRLSPEQRREVEDFVNFLIQRSGTSSPAPEVPSAAPPPLINIAPPSITLQEPSMTPEPVKIHNLIRIPDTPDPVPQEDPVTLLMQEIAVDDSMANDYMDYGRYEQPRPSPAIEAVKRVKEKIGQKRVHEPANQILDWIN
ncbi:MAG: hypothetical protein OS112_10725 [Methanoregula sp.]|nr:MAG: hypothetical protein OS112_10725 [Methanoregula sp.]